MYGFPAVSEMGASLEELVDALRSGRRSPTAPVVDLVEACAAALRNAVQDNHLDDSAAAEISELAWRCECALRDTPVAADPPPDLTPPTR